MLVADLGAAVPSLTRGIREQVATVARNGGAGLREVGLVSVATPGHATRVAARGLVATIVQATRVAPWCGDRKGRAGQ